MHTEFQIFNTKEMNVKYPSNSLILCGSHVEMIMFCVEVNKIFDKKFLKAYSLNNPFLNSETMG